MDNNNSNLILPKNCKNGRNKTKEMATLYNEIDQSTQSLDELGDTLDSDFEDDAKNKNTRKRTASGGSSGSSDIEENLIDTLKKAPIMDIMIDNMPYQPIPLIRRLSQCKEEEEEEEDKFSPPKAYVPSLITIENKHSKEVTIANNRFIVTKASPIAPRHELIKKLENLSPKQNSQTIHFPCSVPTRQTAQSIFSPSSRITTAGHVSNAFFDTSLVEIRPQVNISKSIDDISVPIEDDNIWIKRPDSAQVFKKKKADVSIYFNWVIFISRN